jgi:hypothetical protein
MTTTKRNELTAAVPYAVFRDTAAMLKATLDATEKNYFAALDRANSETATAADKLALMDAAEKYAVAAVRFGWQRVDSTTGRALDSFAARAADTDLTDKQRAAAAGYTISENGEMKAAKNGYNAVILKLKNTTAAAVKQYLLSMVTDAAADSRAAAYMPDCMDVLSAAVLSILETAAARSENRAAAAADNIGIFDYQYTSDSDSRNTGACCDVKRANRAAERYINGQRGLNLETTAKTCLLESLPVYVQEQESLTRWRRAGVYAGLNTGAYVQDTTMQNVRAVLSFLNISGRALEYTLALSRGLNESQVAARFGVSRQAVNKSVKATAQKARAALALTEYTPTGTAAERRAALDRARATAATTAADSRRARARADRAAAIAADKKADSRARKAAARVLKSRNKTADAAAETYAKAQAAAALAAMREYRARDSIHAAPVYTTEYKTQVFRHDIAAAVNSISRALFDVYAAENCRDTYARQHLARLAIADSQRAAYMRQKHAAAVAADRADRAAAAVADRDAAAAALAVARKAADRDAANRAAAALAIADSFISGQRADRAAAAAVAADSDSLKKATEKRRDSLRKAADRAAAALAVAVAADNGTTAAAAVIERRQRTADRAAAALSEYQRIIDSETRAALDRAAADRAEKADRAAADRTRAAVRAANRATAADRAAAAAVAAADNRDRDRARADSARAALTAAADRAAREYAAAVAALTAAADRTPREKLALRQAVRAAAETRDRAAAAVAAAALIVA